MTERNVSSERVSEELSGVAVARLTIEQVAIEAMEHVKDGDSFGSAARNPTTIRTRQLLERLATDALRSSVKTVGPTPDQVLDAANDYAMEQYGMGFLSHPVDRQRILSAIEAPTAANEVTEDRVIAGAQRVFELFCGKPIDWSAEDIDSHESVLHSADWAQAIAYSRAALKGDRS